MSVGDYAAIGGLFLSVLTVVVIPTGVLLVRYVVRLAAIEHRLGNVMTDVKEMVESSKDAHDGFDRRLRWLEENLWQRRKGNSNAL